MFDFLGKKPNSTDKSEPRPKAADNSLLDVVVPFSPKQRSNGTSARNKRTDKSLLNKFEDLAQERQQIEAERQAAERAELRAKKAAFEQREQLARIEADQHASRQFEEKANKLALEIERVRQSKYQEAGQFQPEPTHNDNASPVNSQHRSSEFPRDPYERDERSPNHVAADRYVSREQQERQEFERFQNWRRTTNAPQEQNFNQSQPPRYSEPSRNYPEWERGEHYRDGYSGYRSGRDADASKYRYRDNRATGKDGPVRPPEQARYRQYSDRPINPPPENYRQSAAEMPGEQPSASGGLYGQNQPSEQTDNQPSAASGLDLDKIFASILGSWKLIGLFAIAGAVIAGVYAKSLPNKYQAWAELLIDPQGITLIDKQLSSTGYGGEAMIAYLESQLRIIESTSVLNVVIDAEKLYDDPEFSEKGAVGSGLMNILNPLSSNANKVRDRQVIIDNLQDKLTIARGSRTFIVSIGMMTEDGEKSARIANALAKAYVNGESGARSKIARDASEDLSDKLETLRNRVLLAERKVANYKAENGLVITEGKLISEVQLSRINEQLAIARVETVNARTKMEQLRTIDLSDVVSGALPASLNSGTLSQLRVRYATLKSTADRLATKLGPKHPERIAASAELASARGQISREIRRSIAGSEKDYERAKKRQKGLSQQLNTVKAAAAGTGNSLIALRELERELDAHKKVYEDYLLRSRETSEQEGLTTTNARVISKATPPLKKASPNRKVIAGVGLIAGGALGLMIALLKGMLVGRWRLPKKASRNRDNDIPDTRQYEKPAMQNHHDPRSQYHAPRVSGLYDPRSVDNPGPQNYQGEQDYPYHQPPYRRPE